ncbi:uncharacterized protein [Zea mays]|uniref:uncharacterized protein isoform X1 n=1 Tax=Zea mays TaxID=4577 RepID=UPI0004DEC689|nr:uncharacterized protein LOC100278003 isoform X1 [Zea mays]|eukprot:XP_008647682.1 uncharacterized protein LOC100278003 isoform X1 [Zea mays]
MVVLHVKLAPPAAAAATAAASSPMQDVDEETEFLYECAASAVVADVAAALGALAGLQAAILSLCRRLRARCAGAMGELERALDEAEAYASKVQRNRFLSPRALREHIKNIEKKCANTLQEPLEALSLQESSSDNKHERIQIWWAGKELAMDQKLSDYIGVNDKTKIVVRLIEARDEC